MSNSKKTFLLSAHEDVVNAQSLLALAELKLSDFGNPKQSGAVPEGDVRLVANIRSDLHKKLKHRAVDEETTVGELIERWIEGWTP